MREHAEPHKKPSSIASDRRLLSANIIPKLGGTKVSAITRSDISGLHYSLRHTPYEANRTIALLSKMFNLAEAWDYRPDGSNPCRHVKRFREKIRERFFSTDELQRIGNVLANAEDKGVALPGAITAIRLLALTGSRMGEILALKWEDIDLENAVLRFTDAKAGARTMPIASPVQILLAGLERDGPFVVHGPDGTRPLSRWTLESAWQRIRALAEITDGRLHDFRHTVGTYSGQAGFNAFVVRDLLGHKTLAMTGRYVERDTDPLRDSANHVSGKIAAALSGSEGQVISLSRTNRA